MALFLHSKSRRMAFWVSPVIGASTAVVLAALFLLLDHTVDWQEHFLPVFAGEADTARTLLSVIAGSVTTLIALVFTILAVIIQLASSQYSPRALNTLLDDPPSHWTIGVFVGTFTYCLVILLALRFTAAEGDVEIAGLSLTFAFALAVISIGTFAVYSNHIIHSARITRIVTRIAEASQEVINRHYQEKHQEENGASGGASEGQGEEGRNAAGQDPRQVPAPNSGIMADFDEKALLGVAMRIDGMVRVLPRVGAFVTQGSPVLELVGKHPIGAEELKELGKHVRLSPERSLDRDLGFGLRQLVDIAARALSTGINDPATAVQVIDQLHELMRILSDRRLGTATLRDERDIVRIRWNIPSWEELTGISLNELRLYGQGSVHVMRRLRALVVDLISMVPESRKGVLRRQIKLLDESVARSFHDPEVIAEARKPDSGGAPF
jgi:uncharacterized membrane protein